ncbi:putative drug resistance protein [Gordonia effusa NBRC 100432]|uniref:Putative drug resistance protein n=1 Tax=Gordonia effusa NBRC 100432 TaxID=1077974 RepID=H0QW99_9ACTN|nr:MFS transporter [Gordonia effusa]GAB17100.1 putative drug resistance protein [Gordonia effusa NBRC 100432]
MNTSITELNPRQKALVLLTCSLSLLISSMDITIVNVALPDIRTDLGAGVSSLQWVVDVYTLTLASLLMVSGAMADRFGRRRIFRIGLVIFALGSLLCSLAPTIGVLIAARFLQAVGGSMLNPVAMSIITATFTDRVERARAIGVWGAVVGVSTAIGPMVGGFLIHALGWQSVFWINLPIVAVALAGTFLVVPESKAARSRSFDPIGQLLAVVTMFTVVFALIEKMPLLIVISVIAGAAFIVHERRYRSPFLDLRFFRSVPFSAATITAVCAFAGFGAFLFTMSIYLQGTRGLSPVQAGAMFLPMALAVLVLSPLSGRFVGKYGARPSLVGGGVLMTLAAGALTGVGATTSLVEVALIFAVFGMGFGLLNAPITNAAVSGMPVDQAGAAAAVASSSRQVGITFGVALCGQLSGAGLWWTVTGLAAIVAVLGVAATGAAAERSRQSVADLLDGASESTRV